MLHFKHRNLSPSTGTKAACAFSSRSSSPYSWYPMTKVLDQFLFISESYKITQFKMNQHFQKAWSQLFSSLKQKLYGRHTCEHFSYQHFYKPCCKFGIEHFGSVDAQPHNVFLPKPCELKFCYILDTRLCYLRVAPMLLFQHHPGCPHQDHSILQQKGCLFYLNKNQFLATITYKIISVYSIVVHDHFVHYLQLW